MLTISSEIKEEIVGRLADEFQPEAIYLFGSHAWGNPDGDSDLDLLVVVSGSTQTPVERSQRAQRSLRGCLAPVDVLVKTRSEFERNRTVYASLEAQIYEKGKLLYGRQARTRKKLAR